MNDKSLRSTGWRRVRPAFGEPLPLWLADTLMLRCRRSASPHFSAGCTEADLSWT